MLSNFSPQQASLDLMSDVIPIPPMVIASEPNTEVTQDLFSLLYVSESTEDRTVVPPSRWATFECKNTL